MLACDNCGKELGRNGEVYDEEYGISGYRCKKCDWLTETTEDGLGKELDDEDWEV